ncbi:MAG: metallophosphatase family protein [Thermanaerothrix sp.]|nr:metallophosphatase family protein [Thermanaerothrix sp.]
MGRFFVPPNNYGGPQLDLARGARRFLEAMGFIPPQLDGSRCILHISDTPSSTYGYIRRAVLSMRPMMVIHTGDVADEVKVGLWPSLKDEYVRKVSKLSKALEAVRDVSRLVITCGNHDLEEVLKDLMPWAKVHPVRALLTVGGRSLKASHRHSDLGELGDVNLFGHDLELRTSTEGDRIMLNGIERMNLLDTADWSVRFIRYPPGTDDERTLRRRRGL